MPGNSAVKCSRRTWGMAAVYGLVLGSCTDSCVKGSTMVLVGGMPSRMQAAANLSTAKQVLQFTRHTQYCNCCCLLCAEQGGGEEGRGVVHYADTPVLHKLCTSRQCKKQDKWLPKPCCTDLAFTLLHLCTPNKFPEPHLLLVCQARCAQYRYSRTTATNILKTRNEGLVVRGHDILCQHLQHVQEAVQHEEHLSGIISSEMCLKGHENLHHCGPGSSHLQPRGCLVWLNAARGEVCYLLFDRLEFMCYDLRFERESE